MYLAEGLSLHVEKRVQCRNHGSLPPEALERNPNASAQDEEAKFAHRRMSRASL